MIYYLSILFFKFYFFFLLDITVTGIENVPDKGPAILVSNHPSLLDGPLLAASVKRRLYAYAKKSVFNSRIKLLYLKGMGGIPVELGKFDRQFMTETKRRLDDEKLLLIFPEGKINSNSEPGEFNNSFVKLALRFNVTIIPVTIRGSEKSLRKGQKFPRPAKVEIIYGEPLKLDYGKGRLTKDEVKQAVDKVKKMIQKNLGREYQNGKECRAEKKAT